MPRRLCSGLVAQKNSQALHERAWRHQAYLRVPSIPSVAWQPYPSPLGRLRAHSFASPPHDGFAFIENGHVSSHASRSGWAASRRTKKLRPQNRHKQINRNRFFDFKQDWSVAACGFALARRVVYDGFNARARSRKRRLFSHPHVAVLVLLAAAARARVVAADLLAAVADRLRLLVGLLAACDGGLLLRLNAASAAGLASAGRLRGPCGRSSRPIPGRLRRPPCGRRCR